MFYFKFFFLWLCTCSFVQLSSQECRDQSSIQEIQYAWKGTSDMQVLHDLFLKSFLQNYQKLGLTKKDLGTDDITKVLNDYWDEEVASLKSNHVHWIVAKSDGKVVGYASFNMEDAPQEVYIQLLCVDPAYQKQGIGKKLLYSILQQDQTIKKLSLVTRRVNSSAIAFYQRLGFKENPSINKKANIDKKLCIQLEKSFQ